MLKEILKKFSIENEELEKALENHLTETLSEKSDKMIPIDRFKEVVKQKNEALEKAMNLELEVEKFNQINFKEIKEQNEKLTQEIDTYKTQIFETKKQNFKDVFDFIGADEKSQHYEKAQKIKQSLIDFPDSLEDLNSEILEKNEKIINALRNAGTFEISQNQNQTPNLAKSRTITPTSEPKSGFEGFLEIQQNL